MTMRKWTGGEQDFKELHCCLLIILKEIHRICEKNGIKYFLSDGTLLGAVRHKGFIPWDDDADVGMLRSDFEKFKKVCKTEIGECFSLELEDDLKLRLNGTSIISKDQDRAHQISVDIFPYDNVPDDLLLRKIYSKLGIFCYILKREKNKIKAPSKGFKEFIYNCIVKFFAFLLPKCVVYSLLDAVLSSFNKKNTGYVSKMLGAPYYFLLDTNPGYMYKDLVLVPFEDTHFYILKHYDAVLSHLYGDYMTPPPEIEEDTENKETLSFLSRNTHHIESFDPGNWVK